MTKNIGCWFLASIRKILKAFYFENIDGINACGENIVEMGLNFIFSLKIY